MRTFAVFQFVVVTLLIGFWIYAAGKKDACAGLWHPPTPVECSDR